MWFCMSSHKSAVSTALSAEAVEDMTGGVVGRGHVISLVYIIAFRDVHSYATLGPLWPCSKFII